MSGVVPTRLAARLMVAALMLMSALPANADDVECSEIDLTFDSGGEQPYCAAGVDTGRNAGSDGAGGWGTRWQVRGLDSPERSIVVQVVTANRQTYLPKNDVRFDVDGDPWFTKSSDWAEVYRLGGYEVQRFKGTWKGVNGFWNCAGFTRYARPVAVGGAGYSERLSGAYCVEPEAVLNDESLDRFLKTIGY